MKIKNWLPYIGMALVLVAILLLASFKNSNNPGRQTDVKVTTKAPVNITGTTADCNYTIQVSGTEKVKIVSSGVRVTKVGGVGSKNFEGRLSGGVYLSRLTGLSPASKYSVTAYANTSAGSFSGTAMTFATKEK